MARRPRIYSREPHLWKRPDSGVFYILWQEDGRQRKRSTKTRARARAEAALREFRRRHESEGLGGTGVALHQGARDWLADRERPRRGLDPKTLDSYRRWVAGILGHFPASLLARDLRRRDVRRFLDQLEDEGHSAHSLRRHLSALSMVFNFLIDEEQVRFNPCQRLRVSSASARHEAMPESVYECIVQRMEEEIQSPPPRTKQVLLEDLRDVTVVLWHSGLRYVEAVRVQWDDIDFETQTWTIRSPVNKGGTSVLPMHGAVAEVLNQRRIKGGEGPFTGRYQQMQNTWRRFRNRHPEFKDWRFHCMRHSFVSRIRKNASDLAAMQLARHSTTSMMDLYSHSAVHELREALETG